MSKLRLGCLEIRIEAGRYARPRLPVEARLCQVCGGAGGGGDAQEIEDEFHFLFRCKAYEDARSTWLHRVKKPENFLTLPQNEMLSIVLNEHDNVKHTAQYIIDIYDKRSKLLHNVPNVYQNRTDLYHIDPQNQCPACLNLI